MVHHGGAGTTTTTARAGVPQVVVPQVADQLYWAARVADLGIGVAHDGPVPTAGSLAAALGTALTPDTRARATVVADSVRADGATVAAKMLLDAVGAAGQPGPAAISVVDPGCTVDPGDRGTPDQPHNPDRPRNSAC